jgi:hypothetical protein
MMSEDQVHISVNDLEKHIRQAITDVGANETKWHWAKHISANTLISALTAILVVVTWKADAENTMKNNTDDVKSAIKQIDHIKNNQVTKKDLLLIQKDVNSVKDNLNELKRHMEQDLGEANRKIDKIYDHIITNGHE